ncbi:MAG: hypothetical protein ACRYFX_24860 [Janthinobacterium lividum]
MPSFTLLTQAERVAEVELAYYQQADKIIFRAGDMLAWYTTLSPAQKIEVDLIGIPTWKRLPSLRGYILEKHGYRLPVFMASHLPWADFLYWQAERDEGKFIVHALHQ